MACKEIDISWCHRFLKFLFSVLYLIWILSLPVGIRRHNKIFIMLIFQVFDQNMFCKIFVLLPFHAIFQQLLTNSILLSQQMFDQIRGLTIATRGRLWYKQKRGDQPLSFHYSVALIPMTYSRSPLFTPFQYLVTLVNYTKIKHHTTSKLDESNVLRYSS